MEELVPEKPISVILAEDQEDIRMALETFISLDKGISCLQVFADGLSAWNWISDNGSQLDVALLDIDMPGMNGIELVEKIKSRYPSVQCLMCTVYEENDRIFNALEAGASGYILKKSASRQILEAIRDIHSGGSPMSSEIARRVVQSFNGRQERNVLQEFSLTNREQEILAQLEKGFLYKEIAHTLSISVETVRRHVHNIYEKLHVSNRTEALNKIAGRV